MNNIVSKVILSFVRIIILIYFLNFSQIIFLYPQQIRGLIKDFNPTN